VFTTFRPVQRNPLLAFSKINEILPDNISKMVFEEIILRQHWTAEDVKAI